MKLKTKTKKQEKVKYTRKQMKRILKQDYPFWCLCFVPIVLIFIFRYIPMYGVQIAFRDFKLTKGIWGSEWVGLQNFKLLFRSKDFLKALKNTIELSFMRVFLYFPMPIILALAFNEVRNVRLRKTVQILSYAPNFISWVVIASIVKTMFGMNGPINMLVEFFGGDKILFLSKPELFKPLLVGTHIWAKVGMGSLIYTAALTSVDKELYDACYIDGGGRLARIWYVCLPAISGIIAVSFIGVFGDLMRNNFEQVFLLSIELVYNEALTLEYYNYNVGLVQAKFSIGAATGLWLSGISLVLTVIANGIVRKVTGHGMW